MSYLAAFRIDGQEILISDQGFLVTTVSDLDRPEYVKALKRAAKIESGVDALYSSWWLNLEWIPSELLSEVVALGNVLESDRSITPPEGVLDRCDAVRSEIERRGRKGYEPSPKKSPSPRPPMPGYVYLLSSTPGCYKIGRTKNPKDRLATFSVKLPFPVRYVCVIKTEDMRELEKKLHARFLHRRIDGEWFALGPEDVTYIKSLGSDI